MTSLVAARVGRLLPRSKAAHMVVGEVPAAVGIADVVAVRFDPAVVRRRLDSGIGPLCSPLRVRALDRLRTDRPMRVSTLASKLGSNPRALTHSTLGPLAEMGMVELVGDSVRATGAWEPAATHVTAVELKLSKWRDALRQADNFALSADRSWVVLDSARATSAIAAGDVFAQFGVGLAVLRGAGELQVINQPAGRRPERWLRAIIAERAWAIAESEVAALASGRFSDEQAPAVEELTADATTHWKRQPVTEGNGGVETSADMGAALSAAERCEHTGFEMGMADLMTLGQRAVMRGSHLLAAGTRARHVGRLVAELLVHTPRHGA